MEKEKRMLKYIIGWFIIGVLLFLIGQTGVFASTYYMNYSYQQQYYDNYGSYVNSVRTTWVDSFNSYVSDNITTASGSYGAGLAITSPIPLLSGHTYSMSVYFENINNIALSSKNEISVASSLSASANDYANNIPGTEMLFSKVSNNTILQFVFKVDNNHTHLFFPWTTTSTITQSYVLTQVVMEDLGSSGITENEINQSLNSQTNEINNSIQNSTNIITGEIENLQDSIIDSNKETQDVIKDQFNNCTQFDKNITNFTYGSISGSNGQNTSDSSTTRLRTDYFEVESSKEYTISFLDDMVYQFYIFEYNSNKSFIKRVPPSSWGTNGFTFTTSSNTKYLRFVVRNSSDVSFDNLDIGTLNIKGEEFCQNRLDETNDKLDDINGTLTDDSPTDMSGLEDSIGWLPPGPVDSILTLPLALFNSLSRNLSNKTCITANLELPFVNKSLNLPCVKNLYDKIGITGTLFQTTGIVASCFILFNYLLALYHWIDNTLTLRENTMPGYYEDKWGGGA